MILLSSWSKQEQVCAAILTIGSTLLLLCRQHYLLLNTQRNMTEVWLCSSASQMLDTCDYNKTWIYPYMWVGVYEHTSVHAWVGSDLCVCVWKRENQCLWQSLWASYRDSVALDLCSSCCDAVLCCVFPYRVVFLIGLDVLQPMCTDRGWFGKPQSISPITALAVRLTFWICYSSLFKLEHSLISCPWDLFVGSDCSACTLSQACTQCRRCTVCLQEKSVYSE